MLISIFGTKIDLNWGTLIHIAFGFLAVFFGKEWLFTLIFLFKQAVDLYGGEDTGETSGDIAEYCLGLILGFFFKLYNPLLR